MNPEQRAWRGGSRMGARGAGWENEARGSCGCGEYEVVLTTALDLVPGELQILC